MVALPEVAVEIAGQDAHRRGLAGPVGPEEADDLPRRHVERDVANGGVVAVILGEVADVNHTDLTRVSQDPGFQERLQQACENSCEFYLTGIAGFGKLGK